MNRLFILAVICCVVSVTTNAQTLKLDFFNKMPATVEVCSALYTYDTTSLKKKKYIMVSDFQDKGFITVAGKQIALKLTDTKLSNKVNTIYTYTGGGYTVTTNVHVTTQTTYIDMESGTLVVTKGKEKLVIKIHGQSGCDESKEERN
jgi:hypothetical protein